MTMNRQKNAINLEAFRWALLEEEGPLSVEQEQELHAWLSESPRHQGAYARARAMLLHLQRLGALAGGRCLPTCPSPVARVSRRTVLAASLSAVGLLGTGGWLARDWLSPGARYVTEIGQLRTVHLKDGSTMTINTGTQVWVQFRRTQREVRLACGEALFEVAHEPRPFLVRVGRLTVRAAGTAFVVRREPRRGESMVTVTDGAVQILPPVSTTKNPTPESLAANQEALLTEDSIVDVREVPPAEVARRLAWRKGMLIFNGQPLQTAIAELNRYNRREIVVTDDRLGMRLIFGVFRASDAQTFIESLESRLGARAVNAADGKVLLLPARVNTR
jgi:transmembrane sensor